MNNLLIFFFTILLPCTTFSDQTVCNTNRCVCSKGYSDKYEYNCSDRNGLQYKVVVEIDPSITIKVICYKDYTSSTLEWTELIEGINATRTFTKLIISRCPVPNVSFKKILLSLNIESIEILEFESYLKIDNAFQSFHFENLKFVQQLYLLNNGITSLPDNIFDGVPNLTKLYINNNNIPELTPELFKRIPKLERLDFGHNNVTVLQPGIFKYTPNLVFLNAYSNTLRNLKRAVFSDISKLRSLDLNNNGITLFDDDIFQDLSSLKELNLNFNNISFLPFRLFANMSSLQKFRAVQSHNTKLSTLPNGLFSNLQSLEEITLNSNHIMFLPEDLFNKTAKLKILFLKKNYLETLLGHVFRDTVELVELDISENRLRFLNDTVFQTLKKLIKLRLNKNQLEFINRTVFSSLSSLEELNLKENKLLAFELGSFANLEKLKVIDLSYNQLTLKESSSLNYSPLDKCRNIEEIYLRNNFVDMIYYDWIQTHVKLKILDLSYNKIKYLQVNDLQFLSTNFPVTINLSNNDIRTVDLNDLETYVSLQCYPPASCDEHSIPNREIYFTFEHNPINCDCRSYHLAKYHQHKMKPIVYKYLTIIPKNVYCNSPPHLKNISLREVNLYELQCPWKKESLTENDCPANCSCLFRPHDSTLVVNCSNTDMEMLPEQLPNAKFVKGIDLLFSRNNLTSLNGMSQMFSRFNLTKLSLSHNKLQNIDDLSLSPTLKVLELDNNELSYLSKQFVDKLNESTVLSTMTFDNNQWRCNCDTKYFLNFLQERFKQIPRLNNITCIETGTSIIKLSIDDLCKFSLTFILVCVSLALFGVLFGAIIALYYRYQHEIKVWMFSHKVCLWLVAEKEIDKRKKYDAFISYSHLDEEFVVNNLVPELEKGSHPFRLCLHFRDWMAGELISTQIISSVEESRRTIVVLSPNFLKSVWGKMEFRTAHLKAIKERCARVIVILLKDIGPTDKLDPELKAYLTMNTYVKWNDPWFWQKLKYALPHPQEFCKQRNGMNSKIRNKLNVVPSAQSNIKETKCDRTNLCEVNVD